MEITEAQYDRKKDALPAQRGNAMLITIGEALTDEAPQSEAAQAKILSEPEDKPWKLREFMTADLDGTLIRIPYDFRGDV
jgi:hypothetical protein